MIGNDWDIVLKEESEKDYFKKIMNIVRDEYDKKEIFPSYDRIFYAFRETSYKDTRVVILGQDPYHGVGEANGLCFSVNHGIKIPPSLRNIFKELYNEFPVTFIKVGDVNDLFEKIKLHTYKKINLSKEQEDLYNYYNTTQIIINTIKNFQN